MVCWQWERPVTNAGGDLRRFDTPQHPCYGGIDLHARRLYVWIVNRAGDILLHRPMQAAPEPVLQAVAPSRDGLVVAVACLCTWDWLADLCTAAGLPVVLGHALSMTAMHGGQATHDTLDAHHMAVRLRGGLRPPASVSPAAMRATRARLRRRTHLRHTRAARLAHGHKTTSPDNGPASGQHIADQANRDGVAERCAAPAGPKTLAVDVALRTADAQRRGD